LPLQSEISKLIRVHTHAWVLELRSVLIVLQHEDKDHESDHQDGGEGGDASGADAALARAGGGSDGGGAGSLGNLLGLANDGGDLNVGVLALVGADANDGGGGSTPLALGLDGGNEADAVAGVDVQDGADAGDDLAGEGLELAHRQVGEGEASLRVLAGGAVLQSKTDGGGNLGAVAKRVGGDERVDLSARQAADAGTVGIVAAGAEGVVESTLEVGAGDLLVVLEVVGGGEGEASAEVGVPGESVGGEGDGRPAPGGEGVQESGDEAVRREGLGGGAGGAGGGATAGEGASASALKTGPVSIAVGVAEGGGATKAHVRKEISIRSDSYQTEEPAAVQKLLLTQLK
jgi:hypothetical protein